MGPLLNDLKLTYKLKFNFPKAKYSSPNVQQKLYPLTFKFELQLPFNQIKPRRTKTDNKKYFETKLRGFCFVQKVYFAAGI